MMLNKGQDQKVSEGSTAIQAAGNVQIVHVGLSYQDVRDIALDIFENNFLKLKGEAQDLASARAEEITTKFLTQLKTENPDGVNKAADPDFQHGFFTIQKEYARTGDKDLGDLLVDLLVDRSKRDQRDILQIVLNESLVTASKLTNQQLAVLAMVFLFRYVQGPVGTHDALGAYWDKHVQPFLPKLVKNLATYQHLQFTGCGSVEIGEISLEEILKQTYQGLFQKGSEPAQIQAQGLSVGLDSQMFIACLNDPNKRQVRALNQAALDVLYKKLDISDADRTKINSIFNANSMNPIEIREKCISIRSYMADVFDCWANSSMKNFSLTSVGIAIGHANIKRFVGEFANLSLWIN